MSQTDIYIQRMTTSQQQKSFQLEGEGLVSLCPGMQLTF